MKNSEKYAWLLVNPQVSDVAKEGFYSKNKNINTAVKEIYGKLSEHFSLDVPELNISIKRVRHDELYGGGENNDFQHFSVKEKKTKNGKINFEISRTKVIEDKMDYFKSQLESGDDEQTSSVDLSLYQYGGKKKKKVVSSDSSEDTSEIFDSISSDSSNITRSSKQLYVNEFAPTRVWTYHPYIYGIRKTIVPIFVRRTKPYFFITMGP